MVGARILREDWVGPRIGNVCVVHSIHDRHVLGKLCVIDRDIIACIFDKLGSRIKKKGEHDRRF